MFGEKKFCSMGELFSFDQPISGFTEKTAVKLLVNLVGDLVCAETHINRTNWGSAVTRF